MMYIQYSFCCCDACIYCFFFFFFNDTATTEIYTLSLHDALPICRQLLDHRQTRDVALELRHGAHERVAERLPRSEEHTSELQSPCNLVCRLLLEKKKKKATTTPPPTTPTSSPLVYTSWTRNPYCL